MTLRIQKSFNAIDEAPFIIGIVDFLPRKCYVSLDVLNPYAGGGLFYQYKMMPKT